MMGAVGEAVGRAIGGDEPSGQLRASKMTVAAIPVDLIDPNPWNPNQMPDDAFNRLVQDMAGETDDDAGMIDPVQVVPLDNGRYQILGGEHRWRGAKTLMWETIDCVLLTGQKWQSDDLRKFVTMRLNAVRGKINPEKFMALANSMSEKYGLEALQGLMGFTDTPEWVGLTKGIRQQLKESGVSPEKLKKFDEHVKEVKSVDDLAGILNKMFSEHGETISQNFLVFSFGGTSHMYVACSTETWKTAQKLSEKVANEKLDMSVVLGRLMRAELSGAQSVASPDEPEDPKAPKPVRRPKAATEGEQDSADKSEPAEKATDLDGGEADYEAPEWSGDGD